MYSNNIANVGSKKLCNSRLCFLKKSFALRLVVVRKKLQDGQNIVDLNIGEDTYFSAYRLQSAGKELVQ